MYIVHYGAPSDGTPGVANTYDRLGRQTSAVTAVSTNLFAYDGLDLADEVQNGDTLNRRRISGNTDAVNLVDVHGLLIRVNFTVNNNAPPSAFRFGGRFTRGRPDTRGETITTEEYNFAEMKYVKISCDRAIAGHLSVSGYFYVTRYVRGLSDPLWDRRRDDLFGTNPRTNEEERERTIKHETDHYLTWIDFSQVLHELNSLDGNCYLRCSARAASLRAKLNAIFSAAYSHSLSFHDRPWRSGGMYRHHQFKPGTIL